MINIYNALAPYTNWIMRAFTGWEYEWRDGQEKPLTSMKALSYAPIWYGCNKIAGHVAQLPICVYRQKGEGAERDRRHNVSRLMRHPNLYQTSIVFREQIANHSLLEGSGRAAIVRAGSQITELIPLRPDCTATGMLSGIKIHVTRPPADDRLRLFFDPFHEEDKSGNGLILLQDDEVLHIPGLSFDGINGIALKDLASRNIGASINAEKRLAHQMEKGFSGNLMLSAPVGLFPNEASAKEFLKEFDKRHEGPEGKKTGLLRQGMTANVVATSNKDAEMVENRRFQRQDAALWLGLESILGDDSSVSYNSLEQKNLAYLMNTLNKWLKRWEEEMEWKLLPRRQYDNESHWIRFNTAALLKSDYMSTIEALSLAVSSLIMNPNEAREKLDMNPYKGGEKFQNPNTTSGDGDGAGDSSEAEDPETNARRQAELAVQSRISHLIGVEAGIVADSARQALAKRLNFIEWMDNFYDNKWTQSFADRLEEIGLDRELSTLHCTESKRRLLEVCDNSQPENLHENVQKCVENWKSRALTIGSLQKC